MLSRHTQFIVMTPRLMNTELISDLPITVACTQITGTMVLYRKVAHLAGHKVPS